MIFEIPFKEDIYKKQTNLQLKLYWRETLRKYKKNLLFSIGMVLLGILVIYGKDNIGFIILVIGIYGLLEYYKINTSYKKSKSIYQEIVNNEIKTQLEANENSIWEFNDDYFKYNDCKYEAKIKWNAFKTFRIIEENLFLDVNVGNQSSYIIAKEEVGEESFNNIITFVENKINNTNDL